MNIVHVIELPKYEEIIKAYRETGMEPMVGIFYDKYTVAAHPLGVLYLHKYPFAAHYDYAGNVQMEICEWAESKYGKDVIVGLIDGFADIRNENYNSPLSDEMRKLGKRLRRRLIDKQLTFLERLQNLFYKYKI